VAVWGLGLVVVVGAAVAGGALASKAGPAPSAAAVAQASVPVSVEGSSTSTIDRLSSVINLDAPATTDQLITTSAVVVRGDVRAGVARLQVLLQSRSAEPMVVRTVGALSVDWDRDGPRRIPFVVPLDLPDPRPSGPAVVQLVAYDTAGHARGVFLRRILIGALVDPTYGDGSARPPTGEDGLMGGITSGTSFSWKADGR
jgi:hypothetical protein